MKKFTIGDRVVITSGIWRVGQPATIWDVLTPEHPIPTRPGKGLRYFNPNLMYAITFDDGVGSSCAPARLALADLAKHGPPPPDIVAALRADLATRKPG